MRSPSGPVRTGRERGTLTPEPFVPASGQHAGGGPIVVWKRLGDLQPIHRPGMNPLTERKLRRLPDEDLLRTATAPLDGQMIKTRSGSSRVLDGNTRIHEMQRRLPPDTQIPVDEIES